MTIHACAPVRFFDLGGWTDGAFAEYGVVVNCAVSLPVTVTLQPRERAGIGVYPAPDGTVERGQLRAAAEFARVAARHFGVEKVDLFVKHVVAPGYGLGTTAATAVAVAGVLAARAGAAYAPVELARLAHRLQTEEMGRACGMQSHLAAALGGITCYHLEPYPRVFVTPISDLPEVARRLEEHLILVLLTKRRGYTLYPRLARACRQDDSAARALLWKLRAFAAEGWELLCRGDLRGLGAPAAEHAALQYQWAPGLLCPTTRHIRALARNHQAWAVKPNGAGGSLSILCPAQAKPGLEEELRARGYDVLPVQIDQYGLQVWTYEVTENPGVSVRIENVE
ncbi:MAG: GHMP family kinase ATP-binding protein [Armatimonadota bacterium]